MDISAIYAALTDIFIDAFGHEIKLHPELTANEVPGWDSFKQIEIILACEERFGFKFTILDMDGLKCVGDLTSIVAQKAQ